MTENIKESDNVKNPVLPLYWYWQDAIPEYLIQCLVEETKYVGLEKATTFGAMNRKVSQDTAVRDTDIMVFDPIHWFSGILFNMALSSNGQAGWNFSVMGPEALQIAHYQPGQHYTWHPDSILLSTNSIIRKLTVISMLSGKDEYSGGKLELEDVGEVPLEKGDVIVFPSFIKHRVTPVESGLRKTAVIWVSGYRSW